MRYIRWCASCQQREATRGDWCVSCVAQLEADVYPLVWTNPPARPNLRLRALGWLARLTLSPQEES